MSQRIAGCELDWSLAEAPRIGDHRWWISDLDPFRADYPGWKLQAGIEDILRKIFEGNVEAWSVVT